MTKAVPLTCTGHSRPVTHLAFSGELNPNSCRYTLVSACKSGQPILRNGVTGDWLGTFLGHEGAIWCTRVTRDSRYVVTASADFSVFVWDAQNGDAIVQLPHRHIVRSADFEPGFDLQKGKCRIISGGQDKTIRIWNVDLRQTEIEWSLDNPVRSVVWISTDTVVSTDFSGHIQLWKLSSEPQCIKSLKTDTISGQISYSGNCLVIAAGQRVNVLDAASGQIIRQIQVDYKVSCACLTKDQSQLLTGSSADTWIRIYDAKSGNLLETYKGHHGPVHHIECSPDGKLAASGSEDGTVRIWKLSEGPFGLWM